MSSETVSKKQPTITSKVLEEKWGRSAIEAGFTALPDTVFRQQKSLKLKHLDVLILLHLASYWWKPKSNPWPAKNTLADALDVDPRTVQRSIKKMEDLGYVKRIARISRYGDNLSNEYDLSGLVKAIKTLAEEELSLRESRAEADKQRRKTPTAFALLQGGKRT